MKVWDEELARISQRWADQCMPGHDQRRNVGEALREDTDAADIDIATFNVFTKQMRGKKEESESQTDMLLDRTWRPLGLLKESLQPR